MKSFTHEIIFVFLLFLCSSFQKVEAQPIESPIFDTLNRLDSLGKKTGYWIEYVDNKLCPVKKLKKAVFSRYVFYENGAVLFQKARTSGKLSLEIDGDLPEKGKTVLLNGSYKLYYKKRKLCSEECYSNGKPVYSKSFYRNTGQVKEYINYLDEYNNQPFSYKITIYKSDGSIQESYYSAKVANSWRLIVMDEDKVP